jgi:hypothetical protein
VPVPVIVDAVAAPQSIVTVVTESVPGLDIVNVIAAVELKVIEDAKAAVVIVGWLGPV